MKKLFFGMLTVLFLLLLLCFSVSAETIGGQAGYEQDTHWSLDTETGTLTFSGNGWIGNMTPTPWYRYKDVTKKIVIEEGIVGLSGECFAGFELVTEVQVPQSLKTIQQEAFRHCEMLEMISLPSVSSIDKEAFLFCGNLKHVVFSDKLKTIDESAFSGCDSLQEIILPDSLKTIGKHAFIGCESITSITIPAKVEKIGASAFGMCKNLKEVTILSPRVEFGENAFGVIGQTPIEKFSSFTNSAAHKFAKDKGYTFVSLCDGGTHSYGRWESFNETHHQRFCSCAHQDTAVHAWNEGQVTKQPTDTDPGEKVYICSTCSQKKKEVLAALNAPVVTTVPSAQEASSCQASFGMPMLPLLVIVSALSFWLSKKKKFVAK